jgi:hypothetical protein
MAAMIPYQRQKKSSLRQSGLQADISAIVRLTVPLIKPEINDVILGSVGTQCPPGRTNTSAPRQHLTSLVDSSGVIMWSSFAET